MVGARQDLVVEREHHQREHERQRERRHEQLAHRNAASLERGDLVLRGQSAEGVEDRDEHGHRQGHRDGEGYGQKKELRDDLPMESLADQVPELSRDVLQQHQRREGRQREGERPEVLLEYVTADYFHVDSWRARARTTSVFPQCWTPEGT